jgi:hypothetical protein
VDRHLRRGVLDREELPVLRSQSCPPVRARCISDGDPKRHFPGRGMPRGMVTTAGVG